MTDYNDGASGARLRPGNPPDRRAEAFAVLDEWEARYWDHTPAVTAALRSILKRHQPGGQGPTPSCRWCGAVSPCPDEQAVIDALLGAEDD